MACAGLSVSGITVYAVAATWGLLAAAPSRRARPAAGRSRFPARAAAAAHPATRVAARSWSPSWAAPWALKTRRRDWRRSSSPPEGAAARPPPLSLPTSRWQHKTQWRKKSTHYWYNHLESPPLFHRPIVPPSAHGKSLFRASTYGPLSRSTLVLGSVQKSCLGVSLVARQPPRAVVGLMWAAHHSRAISSRSPRAPKKTPRDPRSPGL